MSVYKLYQVYCIEEGITRQVNSFTEPTECPVIHTDRTIDPAQTIVIDYIEIKPNRVTVLIPKITKISSTSYKDLKVKIDYDTSLYDKIIKVKFRSTFNRKSGTGDFTFRIFDKGNKSELQALTINTENTSDNNIYFDVSPTTNTTLEFQVKVSDSKDDVDIDDVSIYYLSSV